jgi:exodeoxyribonuclease X
MGLVSPDPALCMPPHRAAPDAYATALILSALYAAGVTGKDLMNWTAEPRVLPRCPIGAWRGHKWEDVEYSMLEWIAWKARDLDEDVRWNARREMDRRDLEKDDE